MKANLILYEYCIQLNAASFIKILVIARKRVIRYIYIFLSFFIQQWNRDITR